MRPQQNRRMRGRGNNNNNNNNNNINRRSPNPLSRNYESNGPDVKIRGNAQHIAEKYAALARDAQVSGDRVIAENYLQHAEHYNRIIMAAQAQMPQLVREEPAEVEGEESDNGDKFNQVSTSDTEIEPAGSGPQPTIEGVPAEIVGLEDENVIKAANKSRAPSKRRNMRTPIQKQAQSATVETSAAASPGKNTLTNNHEVVDEAKLPAFIEGHHSDACTSEVAAKPRRGRKPRVMAEEAKT